MGSIIIGDKTYTLYKISYDGTLADRATLGFHVQDTNDFECTIPIDELLKGGIYIQIYLEAAVKAQAPEKPLGLKQAENLYIEFMRSLGLPDKASTAEIEALCMQMYSSGVQENINQALMISAKALALINNVTQNGGKWADIEWHEEE